MNVFGAVARPSDYVAALGGVLSLCCVAWAQNSNENAERLSGAPVGAAQSDLLAVDEQVVALIAVADRLISDLRRESQRQPGNAVTEQMLTQAEENRQRLRQRLDLIRRLRNEPPQ